MYVFDRVLCTGVRVPFKKRRRHAGTTAGANMLLNNIGHREPLNCRGDRRKEMIHTGQPWLLTYLAAVRTPARPIHAPLVLRPLDAGAEELRLLLPILAVGAGLLRQQIVRENAPQLGGVESLKGAEGW